jgi:hypothetical protein
MFPLPIKSSLKAKRNSVPIAQPPPFVKEIIGEFSKRLLQFPVAAGIASAVVCGTLL